MFATRPTPALRKSFRAEDARADGCERDVFIDRDHVRIARRFQGVAMRIGVPLSHYRGVLLSLEAGGPRGSFYRISLLHRDPELNVTLDELSEEAMMAAAWRDWSDELALPPLVEQAPGEYGVVERAKSPAGPAARRSSPVRSRRGRFARRRKPGRVERMQASFQGEREIIARR